MFLMDPINKNPETATGHSTFGGLGSDFPNTCPIKALLEGFYTEV